jgi:hypothetical protein
MPPVIHPIYEFKHWPSPYEAIGRGVSGTWDPNTDQVKEAMLPVIYLASMLVESIMSWPWYV